MNRSKTVVVPLIIGIVAVIVGGGFYLSNEGSQGSKATLEVSVWNDSQAPRIDVSISIDENVVWEDNIVREGVLDNDTFWEVHPACKSFQVSLKEEKHDLRAVSWTDNLKVERKFEIEIPDENFWIVLRYSNKDFRISRSDDRPIVIS